jgi:hypothetical protein
MLLVPAHSVIGDVTVHADDELFFVYYLIASSPSVRLDKNGKPVFLLVEYALSDQDRQAHPDLPTGGGYLAFDAALAVDDASLDAIKTTLQAEVNAEWNRRKAGTAEEQASEGVAGTTAPPPVRFDTPTFTKGSVALDAPQATELVTARVAEGAPSLLAGDAAAFNLDLTPAGATFMSKTLLGPDGSGATDLTPIQVIYDLSFWARLPPVGIIVTADSQKVYEYVRTQLEGRGVDYCTTYDYDHTDIENATMTASGAITVSIDQGSGSLPPETVNQLRDYALDLVKQMISSSFFTSKPQTPSGDDMPADAPADGQTRKWFRKQFDSTTMNLNVHLEQRSVVEWNVHPQGTLESFFSGMPASELTQFVKKLDLSDPFFDNLEVTARAFADFAGPVEYVTVDLSYGPAGQEKTTSVTLTDETPSKPWVVGLIDGKREYRYRTAIAYAGQGTPEPSQWQTSSSPTLDVQADTGTVDVTVLGGDIDWPHVDQVQVTVAYEDSDLGIAREEGTVILTAGKQEDDYKRIVYKPVEKQPQYRARFALSSGEVDADTTWHPVPGPQIVINQDSSAILRVNLLPTGNAWPDIARVMVDLRYQDAANHVDVEDTIDLESIDQFKTWSVSLKDKTKRSYDYRWTASFKSGQLTKSGNWQTVADGNPTLPIAINRSGIDFLLVPDAIDFKICPVVEVTCEYSGAGVERQETFVFRDKTSQTWHVDAPDGAPVAVTWQITYSPGDRDPVRMPEQREDGSVVILPPYRPGAAGKLVVPIIGNLVDYTTTPVVAVDLTYDDEPNGVHQTGSIVLNKDQPNSSWQVDLKDPTATQFEYTITYYTTDGNAHPQAPHHETVPRIVVPKYQP